MNDVKPDAIQMAGNGNPPPPDKQKAVPTKSGGKKK